MALKAILFSCSLKPKGQKSSTEAMLGKLAEALTARGVQCEHIYGADSHIFTGTQSDMGPGDAWPEIHRKILESDIIVIGTPIWLGQRGSVCQKILERFDAMLSEKNDCGQLPLYGKVAGVCVVGNEDGVQHVGASILYNLMQIGATIPPNAEAYWVGPAGGRDDFVDVAQDDPYVAKLIEYLSSNLVHVASSLKKVPIPADGNLA